MILIAFNFFSLCLQLYKLHLLNAFVIFDFRKMLDLITLHLPLIAEEIEKQAPFPSKQVKLFSKGDDYQTVQNRVSSFQIWLRAVCKHPECWQLRELLEFLDDSSTIGKYFKSE